MKTRSFIIRLLLLTSILFSASCAASTPLPTSTPPATRTSTPTREATATPTTTPEATATKIATATELPLPEGVITDFAAKLKGSYELHWKGDSIILVDAITKQEVPEIKFDENGNWLRAYTLEYASGDPIEITVKETLDDINLESTDNKVSLDFSAWRIDENDEWVRKNVINTDPKAGVEMETIFPLYSIPEMIKIIRVETQKIKDANGGKLPDSYSELSSGHIFKFLPSLHSQIIKIQGTEFELYVPEKTGAYTYMGYNRIYVRNPKTGQYDIDSFAYTDFYAYTSVDKGGRYGYLRLENLEGIQEFFVDYEKLNEHTVKEPNFFRAD